MAIGINARQLKEKMDSEKGVLILDLRSSVAYNKWHIEGKQTESINMQFLKIKELGSAINKIIPLNKKIVTVCEKGVLAKKAANILEEFGYDVTYLSGGMEEWSEFYEVIPVYDSDLMKLYQIIRPAKGCLSYFIAAGDEAVIVDPSRHTDIYQELANKLNVSIRHVIDTHLHADHISGGKILADRTGAKYWIAEEEMLDSSIKEYTPLPDKKNFRLGYSSLELISIKTPGHTIASTCLLLDNKYLLSGDTLFVNGVGRPDLKGRAREMSEILFKTVTNILNSLKDDLIILPGHFSHPSEINEQGFIGASFANVKKQTELLSIQDKEEFISAILERLGETPPNFERIIQINQGKYEAVPSEQSELEIGPNLCAVQNR
ncbi:glyoxylase-like metal-dependent hydrolase (beta-lactamase superfamily II) [Anoxybacillus tepidamans]|uniref:Glyoxylase-like metal-dependent hydrolase (Beta-lactamase superfamily II) n=1 Tax=Anoxybacteroides tepidamans TaxID=265948 RepID=A0A7W8ITM2_9BACL|nr:MBL fold metallo-hydrolase [Anoxybacillus tepidamans]MBB5326402.1 glyoxylase-like metal-dependent hydrolase (beta-lactamase superfamily II) [Anoxybacillus tepidamans]